MGGAVPTTSIIYAVDWKSIYAMLGVVSIIVSAVVTLSTIYLKFFFKSSLLTFEVDLMDKIKKEFSQKELTDQKLQNLQEKYDEMQEELTAIRGAYFKDRRGQSRAD